MKARTIAGVLACAVAMVLSLPGLATAATRHAREPARTYTELELRGTHGFHLSLSVTPDDAIVSAIRFRGEGLAAVDYLSREPGLSVGDPTHGFVDVRIGRLGHLRGHLRVESTKTEALERGCAGAPTQVEEGVFVGSFRFRGERDYTEVHATRAHGSVTRRAAESCVFHVPRRHPAREAAARRKETRAEGEFELFASNPAYTISVQAERRKERPQIGGEFASVSASVTEKTGNWSISRFTSADDFSQEPTTDFQVPDLSAPLTEATIAPPQPFSGAATFRSDGAKAGSWTGDLKVRLPGAPPVPLTGGGIEAGLCVGGSGCTKTLPSILQPVLEAPPGTIVAVGIKKKK